MRLLKEKSSLEFREKKHSKKGTVSLIIGILAWLAFAALSLVSCIREGAAPGPVGALALLDAVLSLFGGFYAVKGFQEREVYYGMPTAGILLNGSLFVIYFCLYLMGLALA